MASSEFLALGKALTNTIRLFRQTLGLRLKVINPGSSVLVDLMAGAYLEGASTGWIVHGSYLGATANIPAPTVRTLKDLAVAQGQFAAGRFAALADEKGFTTLEELTRWATIAGEASVWKGQDDTSRILARQAEVEFKTWVRAFPREENRIHSVLEGLTIPIDDRFTLPSGVKVFGPRDWTSDPEPSEWVNCGHALTYSATATARDAEQNRKVLFKATKVAKPIFANP